LIVISSNKQNKEKPIYFHHSKFHKTLLARDHSATQASELYDFILFYFILFYLQKFEMIKIT